MLRKARLVCYEARPAMHRNVNGTELFFETTGEGTPLLVMHGGLGFDHQYFRPWLDPLATGAQLTFYDHRGNGLSSRDSLELASHATLVADADALLSSLGHRRAIVLGHSYGGFLALEYALAHPERVAGLVLVATAPALDYPEVVQANAMARATPQMMPVLQQLFAGSAVDDAGLREGLLTLLPLYFHRFQSDFAASFEKIRFSGDAYSRSMGHWVGAYNVTSRLGELAMPVLVISGSDDWITPLEQGGQRLKSGIRGARLEVFGASGHYPFIEEPQRFVSVVSDFLRELRASRSAAR